MSNLLEEFLKDAEVTDVTSDSLLDISTLAQNQMEWELRVLQLETDLEHAKEALKQIQENLLPEAMLTVGMKTFTLANGGKITIKEDIFASIRKECLGQAVNWLDENGLGGIVKDQVNVDFGRGELSDTKMLLDFCKDAGFNASEKLSVHSQTLKATIKEQMAKGVQFPEEFFSVMPFKKSVIKTR